MENVIIFLRNYWREILDVVVLIVSVVMFIVRKRAFVYDNSNQLYSRVGELIIEAENKWPNGHGKEKLRFVVDTIIAEKCGGYSNPALEHYLISVVENILSTPQKKGENDGTKNKKD